MSSEDLRAAARDRERTLSTRSSHIGGYVLFPLVHQTARLALDSLDLEAGIFSYYIWLDLLSSSYQLSLQDQKEDATMHIDHTWKTNNLYFADELDIAMFVAGR